MTNSDLPGASLEGVNPDHDSPGLRANSNRGAASQARPGSFLFIEIEKMLRAGYLHKTIRVMLNCSHHTVCKVADKCGLQRRPATAIVNSREIHRYWPGEKTKQLRDLWFQDEISTRAMGRIMGISHNAVIGKAHRIGLPKRRVHPNLALRWKKETEVETIKRKQEWRGCLHMTGDPSDYDWSFCQNETDGGSWCPEHRKIVFQKPVNIGQMFRLENLGVNVK